MLSIRILTRANMHITRVQVVLTIHKNLTTNDPINPGQTSIHRRSKGFRPPPPCRDKAPMYIGSQLSFHVRLTSKIVLQYILYYFHFTMCLFNLFNCCCLILYMQTLIKYVIVSWYFINSDSDHTFFIKLNNRTRSGFKLLLEKTINIFNK